MKFYSRNDTPETIPTPTGMGDTPIYGIEYDNNGAKVVIVKGIEDRYAQAQVHKEMADVNNIVKRYTEGDIMALNKAKTMYGDFTTTPKTLMDAMNMVQNGKEMFEKLPLEIRKEFNHDPEQFVRAIGTEKFNKLIYPEKIAAEEVKEVTENAE